MISSGINFRRYDSLVIQNLRGEFYCEKMIKSPYLSKVIYPRSKALSRLGVSRNLLNLSNTKLIGISEEIRR